MLEATTQLSGLSTAHYVGRWYDPRDGTYNGDRLADGGTGAPAWLVGDRKEGSGGAAAKQKTRAKLAEATVPGGTVAV